MVPRRDMRVLAQSTALPACARLRTRVRVPAASEADCAAWPVTKTTTITSLMISACASAVAASAAAASAAAASASAATAADAAGLAVVFLGAGRGGRLDDA